MPAYHEVMNTDLSRLTTAAAKWEAMADQFETLETTYQSKVQSISGDGTWTGFSASAAAPASARTRLELDAAQKEARAVASLLRDAHAEFADLVGKVKSAVKDAERAGMTVTSEGRAYFDSSKVDRETASQARHDPGLPGREAYWNRKISNAVQAVSDCDYRVKLGLRDAAKVNALPWASGFNSKAEGDLEDVESISEHRFKDAEKYIYDEMMRNSKSSAVEQIKYLLRPPSLSDSLTGRNAGSDALTALTIWGVKVGPGQDWDHKPKIQDRYDLTTEDDFYFKEPGQKRAVYYDIYSNVHYGYVGRAAGIDRDTLIAGASLGEGAITGGDDAGDQITMRIGMDLYDRYGDDMTREQLNRGIAKAMDEMQEAKVVQTKWVE